MSLPRSSTASTTPSCYFLLHSHTSRGDDSTSTNSNHSSIEFISPTGAAGANIPQLGLGSFQVSSTIKYGTTSSSTGGSGSHGRIDLLHYFHSGFVAVTFTDSARLVIYHIPSQTKQNQSTLPEKAKCMCVDEEGRYLIVGSATGRLRIYTLSTGALTLDMRTHHDRGLNVLKLDRTSKYLVCGAEDGIVSVYDFAALLAAAYSGGAGGRATASSSAAQSALVLSISDHTLAITSIHVTMSNHILTASKDGSIRYYPLEVPCSEGGSSSSSSTIASSSSSSTATSPPCLFHHVFRGFLSSVTLSSDERLAYIACGDEIRWIDLYSSATNHQIGGVWKGHASNILTLALDDLTKRLVSLDTEGIVKMWDLNSGNSSDGICLKTFPKYSGAKNLICVQMNGSQNGSSSLSSSSSSSSLTTTSTKSHPYSATSNTYYLQHSAPQRGSSGLMSKEASWIFPPLNSSNVNNTTAATGLGGSVQQQPHILYVPLSIIPRTPLNSEMQQRLLHSTSAKKKRAYQHWIEEAKEELSSSSASSSSSSARSDMLTDYALITGRSGWSSLTESQQKRETEFDRVQNQLDSYQIHTKELYQLCVEKLFKEVNQPSSSSASSSQAPTTTNTTATATPNAKRTKH